MRERRTDAELSAQTFPNWLRAGRELSNERQGLGVHRQAFERDEFAEQTDDIAREVEEVDHGRSGLSFVESPEETIA